MAVCVLGVKPSSLPTEPGFSWLTARAQRKHIQCTETQDVHLVFLDLRWSRCVTLVFSLLTTSSCLLFLLGKREGRFHHLLVHLALFNTDHFVSQLSFPQEKGTTFPCFRPHSGESKSFSTAFPTSRGDLNPNLFPYSPLPIPPCCIRFHLDLFLLLLLNISIASPHPQPFVVPL